MGYSCTIDTCSPGTEGSNAETGCVGVPSNELCDDSRICTLDECNPESSNNESGCSNISQDFHCNDNNACTEDTCSRSRGCEYNKITCDDRNACTIDYCDEKRGCQITWKDCDDNNPCTIDSCDELTGNCINEEKVCSDPFTVCSVDLFGECVQQL